MSQTRLAPAADRSQWIALVVLCAGFLMIILDQTIVNVALPSIQTDLHFTQSALAWVVNAYLIAFGGLLLLVGRLGDLIGRRRIFLAGLTVFTTASLVCGLADGQGVLIGARFVQGVGGAMTSAVILGMIVTMFPRPSEQAKAIGVYSFVAAAGGAIGLLAGGVLTQAINWHWIFFVNLPIGVATGILATRLLPDDRGIGLQQGADAIGALLLVGSLMLAVYTIVEASDYGWGSLHTLGFGAVAVGLLGAFVLRQATAASPLIPLRVFGSRTVTVANLMQVLMVAGMFGMFFLGALYLQRVLRYDAIEVGLAFLPVAVGIAALSLRLAAGLMMRFGAKPTLIGGLVLVAAGLIVFRRAPVDAGYLARPAPGDGAAGRRGGAGVPRADDARHVGGHAGGLGARLRAREHDPTGRRSARARRAGHAGQHPHGRRGRATAPRPPPLSPTVITLPSRSRPSSCWRRSRSAWSCSVPPRRSTRVAEHAPEALDERDVVLEDAA